MFLNLFAYSDGSKTNNPQLRDFDYSRRLSDVATSKVRSQQHIISVGEQETVLSMQRSLTTGASWTITNPEGVTARYTWSGTNPVLRTERTGGSLVNGSTIAVARQASSKVVRLTFSVLPAAGVVSGDEIFLGEGSGLDVLNQGIFTVVGASGNTVDVLSEDMVNQPATAIVDVNDVYLFSAGPVRVGDFLRVASTSFNFGNRDDFQITRITSRWVEVQNSDLVPEGPITADVVVYDQLYRWTYVETDQRINLYLNGGSEAIPIEPVQEGEAGLVGVYLVRGPVFSVRLENVGLNAANCTTFFAT